MGMVERLHMALITLMALDNPSMKIFHTPGVVLNIYT